MIFIDKIKGFNSTFIKKLHLCNSSKQLTNNNLNIKNKSNDIY